MKKSERDWKECIHLFWSIYKAILFNNQIFLCWLNTKKKVTQNKPLKQLHCFRTQILKMRFFCTLVQKITQYRLLLHVTFKQKRSVIYWENISFLFALPSNLRGRKFMLTLLHSQPCKHSRVNWRIFPSISLTLF